MIDVIGMKLIFQKNLIINSINNKLQFKNYLQILVII